MRFLPARLVAVFLACALASSSVPAQEAPSPKALSSARELLELLQVEKLMHASIVAMLDEQITTVPAMAPMREVMLAWATKYMSLEYTGDALARIYAEEFSEEELRELLVFYRTPLGAKLAERGPVLTQKGAAVGGEVSRRYMGELERMIEEHMAKTGSAGAPPER